MPVTCILCQKLKKKILDKTYIMLILLLINLVDYFREYLTLYN